MSNYHLESSFYRRAIQNSEDFHFMQIVHCTIIWCHEDRFSCDKVIGSHDTNIITELHSWIIFKGSNIIISVWMKTEPAVGVSHERHHRLLHTATIHINWINHNIENLNSGASANADSRNQLIAITLWKFD